MSCCRKGDYRDFCTILQFMEILEFTDLVVLIDEKIGFIHIFWKVESMHHVAESQYWGLCTGLK